MVAELPKREHFARGGVAALMNYHGPEVIIEGPRGTGKTQGTLRWLHSLCCRFNGARILICRSNRTRLTESAMVTFEEEVLGSGHPLLAGASRLNRHSYDYPKTGSSIVLGGLDDANRLLSTPWDIVYVNEVTEIPESLWEEFGGSLRWNHIPWQQRIGDCNPVAPGHWVNKRCDPCPDSLRVTLINPLDMKQVVTRPMYDRAQDYNAATVRGHTKRIVTYHADNPAYWDMDLWDWTKQGIAYVGDQLAKMSGHRRMRFFEGRWKAASGTVYPTFEEKKHTIEPFEIPSDWPIYWGYDAGYDHPTAILWFTISPPGHMYPNGRIYIVGEHVLSGRGVKDEINPITKSVLTPGHATLVRNIEAANGWHPRRRYGDPQHVFNATAQSPRSLAMQWEDCEFQIDPWPRTGGNEEEMVEAVRNRLDDGSLVVFKTCQHTIMEFQSWSYKRLANGELPSGPDAFEDRNNDAMDVVKGVIAAGPTFEQLGCHVEMMEGQSVEGVSGDFDETAGRVYHRGRWIKMRRTSGEDD